MKLAVVTVHGIGAQKPDFADLFHARLQKLVPGLMCFSGYWQGALEPRERADELKLKAGALRHLMLSYAGDAIAYQPSSSTGCYEDIHETLDDALARANLVVGKEGKIVIVAHSLGTVVLSNFLYDLQNPGCDGDKLFHASQGALMAVSKLRGIVTLGSPILLWSLRYEKGGVAIKVPKWVNIYNPADVIGYPMNSINETYAYVEDQKLRVGGLLTRFTPACHTTYFDDRRVIDRVVRLLTYEPRAEADDVWP